MTPFEWLAVACGVCAAVGFALIATGRRQPRSRLVFYLLLVAGGLALGVAIGRLLAASFVAFAALVALYVLILWLLRRRSGAHGVG